MLKRVFSYSSPGSSVFASKSFKVASSAIERVDPDYIDILTSLKSNQSGTFSMLQAYIMQGNLMASERGINLF